jgi:hypothetical protein
MKKLIVLPVIAVIAVAGAYYASPLFINTTVDESLPTSVISKNAAVVEKEVKQKSGESSAMMEKGSEKSDVMTTGDAGEREAMMENEVKQDHVMMEKEMKEQEITNEKESEPTISLSGNFVGAGDGIHNAEGIGKVITINDGQTDHRILRLESFRSTNGPDLYVYLSKDPRSISEGFVNLGRLKGNIGNLNYHIPDDVNLSEYGYVLIWCKQFSVLFGYAHLQNA